MTVLRRARGATNSSEPGDPDRAHTSVPAGGCGTFDAISAYNVPHLVVLAAAIGARGVVGLTAAHAAGSSTCSIESAFIDSEHRTSTPISHGSSSEVS